MFIQVIAIVTFLAAANAGVISAPLATPLTTHLASPFTTHVAAPLAPVQRIATPLAYSAPLHYSTPIAKVAAPLAVAKAVEPEEFDPHPQYSYGYDIQDAVSGDNKQQQETRDGDFVQGSYSLIEPDGTRRVVQYTADPVNGFNAVVSREPLAVKVAAPVVAKAVAPLAYTAPITKVAAPIAYAAPIAKVAAPLAYTAPVAKVAAPLTYAAPVVAKTVVQEEYDPHPQYSYAYDIHDGLTGDNKQQQESRDGDVVQGSYSLVEPDGTRRIVQYTADPVNGFNAVVSKEPLAVKVAAAPVVAKAIAPVSYTPVSYAAPVAKVAAPLAYAAPVAKIFAFVATIAVAKAGIIGSPLATTYSYSAPVAAPVKYVAPAPIARVAAPITYSAPIAKVAAPIALAKTVVQEEYDPNPQYSFTYDIQDAVSGDNKQQQETRNGDVVQGSYSLVEPDGTRRIVQYTADPANGFNAIVSKEPLGVKVAAPVVAKVVAPVTYAAPFAKVAAPLAYAAPIAKVAAPLAYAAPVAKVAYTSPITSYYH
ncbi:structural contituent of cuticle [Holotrichia oblita]|uniref:Structural contituent of cuticle n=1 Tax=Holotrichia oblita TaxID=644536 RepID=A0ACB9SSL8_HOLOL|nr:structural contituent of cuticle [Holotrichia oblita]